jgi:hypothetical protein
MNCTCTEPGLCPVFNRMMTGRLYQICQGTADIPAELREAYLQSWAAKAAGPSPTLPRIDLACIHRREELEAVQCEPCGGKVMVKTWACEVHGGCSLQKNVGVKVCAKCEDHQVPSTSAEQPV